MNRLIAICGFKHNGKDVIADYICDKYGYKNLKISQTLKSAVKILFSFTDEQIESNEKDIIDENWNITPRKVLQFIGTEVMQYKIQELFPDIKRNFWIKTFISKNLNKNDNPNIIISDLRFLHEYEELKKYNVFIIRVERDSIKNNDTHTSEFEHLNIPTDIVIKNNGTINDLYKEIDKHFSP